MVCAVGHVSAADEVILKAHTRIKSDLCVKGQITDIEGLAEQVDAGLREVERQLGTHVREVVTNLEGTHLESVNAQGFTMIVPPGRSIRNEDVLQVVNHSRHIVLPSDREQIQAVPKEFRVDDQRGVQRPIGMPAKRLEVFTHVITANNHAVRNLERVVEARGRTVKQMVVGPLASGLGVAQAEDLEVGCVVVDIGYSLTHIAVFAHGTLVYANCLPIGNGHITQDIRMLLKTSEEEAERLKVEHGCAFAKAIEGDENVQVCQLEKSGPRPMQRRVLCEIIESRVREIAQFVAQQVDKSGYREMIPNGVLLTGGGSILEGIEQAFAQVFRDVSVRVARVEANGISSRSAEARRMAPTVGMIRFATDDPEDEIAPVSGVGRWQEKIRSLKSLFGGAAK